MPTLGCGKRVVLAPLTGRVTFKGKPVADGAQILFANAERGTFITAKLDGDGKFKVGLAEGYGLYPGDYKVAIMPAPGSIPAGDGKEPVIPKFRPDIPFRYRFLDRTPLKMTLPAAGLVYDVEMTP
jgi:hypothetical protein